MSTSSLSQQGQKKEKRYLTDKQVYTSIAGSERSGESSEGEEGECKSDIDEGEEDEEDRRFELEDEGSPQSTASKLSKAKSSSSERSGEGGVSEDGDTEERGESELGEESGVEGSGTGTSTSRSQPTSEVTPLIGDDHEGSKDSGPLIQITRKSGAARYPQPPDTPSPRTSTTKGRKSLNAAAKKTLQAAAELPWLQIIILVSVLLAVVGTGFAYYMFWCVLTPWSPWGDCSPAVRGAPQCGPGVSEKRRSVVRGYCSKYRLLRSRPCDMGQCRLVDPLLNTPDLPCSLTQRDYLLGVAEKTYNENAWTALRACEQGYLCCFPCAYSYVAVSPLECGDHSISPKPLYTSIGCLSCFPARTQGVGGTLSNCYGQASCRTRFASAAGSHEMCCIRVGPENKTEEEAPVQGPTIRPMPAGEKRPTLDEANFRRYPDTSAFLGVLHRPSMWPDARDEAECQRVCWEDPECYIYSYVSEEASLPRWRRKCVTWSRSDAGEYRRSSPSMWTPEHHVYSGFQVPVMYADVKVTVTTGPGEDDGSVGPFLLFVCRKLGTCQVHSPIKLTRTSCQSTVACLDPGHSVHFDGVVAVPHRFDLHGVRIEPLTEDPWVVERITVEVNGQSGTMKTQATLARPDALEFTVGCVTTSGWRVNAPAGSPCLTTCVDGYGLYGWCWVDEEATLWGACVPECKNVEQGEKASAREGVEVSAKSCAQLDWPTWSDYNSNRQVCGASNARPLHGCSGLLSWQAARDFCEAAGARLCTEKELRRDETAGSGCGLDRAPVWSATVCRHGGYITAAGAAKHLTEVPATCTQPSGQSGHARCCGDSRKFVVTFRRAHRDAHALPGRMHIASSGGPGGLASWQVVEGTNFEDKHGFFLQSGMWDDQAPLDSQNVDVTLEDVPIAERGGEIEFRFWIDSERGADKLHFYIDGREIFSGGFPVSGRIDWTLARFAFPAQRDRGLHHFRWRYAKDRSNSVGRDVACIDRITVHGVVGVA